MTYGDEFDNSYKDVASRGWHFRVADDSSRTCYDFQNGIRALDIHGKPHSIEAIDRSALLPDPRAACPFPGLDGEDVVSHVLGWKLKHWGSELISTTSSLNWAIWQALPRAMRRGKVELFGVIPSKDIIHANAYRLLCNLRLPDIKPARDFAFVSLEHMYYRQIPSYYVEWHQAFNLQELLDWLPPQYFKSLKPQNGSLWTRFDLCFGCRGEPFRSAWNKISDRSLAISRDRMDSLRDKGSVDIR